MRASSRPREASGHMPPSERAPTSPPTTPLPTVPCPARQSRSASPGRTTARRREPHPSTARGRRRGRRRPPPPRRRRRGRCGGGCSPPCRRSCVPRTWRRACARLVPTASTPSLPRPSAGWCCSARAARCPRFQSRSRSPRVRSNRETRCAGRSKGRRGELYSSRATRRRVRGAGWACRRRPGVASATSSARRSASSSGPRWWQPRTCAPAAASSWWVCRGCCSSSARRSRSGRRSCTASTL
mmetsp:Transcript_2610/g.8046  ORF Transcript_2610/g.8046 Transcript_2610/m.8046 type:complete len:242 (+) Transcript_2610:708-1433(+)